MKRINQSGLVDVWLIAFIVVMLLFLSSLGFGFWSYTQGQDYKVVEDQEISEAVEKANEELSAKKDLEFLEKEKLPLRVYNGPAQSGSLVINYPKTWSVYVDEKGNGNAPLSGAMQPNFVPGLTSGNNLALRFEVINTPYATAVKSLEGSVKNGKVKAIPYASPSDPANVGLRYDGEIISKKQGAMVMFPLRDKTVKIWSEATQYLPDFNDIILKNFSYKP